MGGKEEGIEGKRRGKEERREREERRWRKQLTGLVVSTASSLKNM